MEDKNYYESLKQRLLKLVEDLEISVSTEQLRNANDYIEVAEYGLAFEALCFTLKENKIPISKYTYKIVEDLGNMMLLDPEIWEEIKLFVIN